MDEADRRVSKARCVWTLSKYAARVACGNVFTVL